MDTRDVAHQYYDAINRRDFDGLSAIVDEHASIVDPARGTFSGSGGARADIESWVTAFPNVRFDLKNVVASGDQVFVEFIARGTHTGAFETPHGVIGATGRSIELPFCDVLAIRDKRIVKRRTYYDTALLLGQLGLIPEFPLVAVRPEELRAQ